MTMHPSPRPSLVAVAAVCALLLSGCASAESPEGPGAQDDVAPTSVPVSESEPASPGGVSPVAVDLPATFPLSDVPLISGVVTQAADAGILWNVIVVPASSMDAVADEAQALLLGAGMTLVGEKGENRAYRSDDYNVNVNLHDDGTVSYTVVPR